EPGAPPVRAEQGAGRARAPSRPGAPWANVARPVCHALTAWSVQLRMFGPKKVLVQIDANLLWEVARDESTGRFIGVCRPLNLNAVGDTWPEFLEAAAETLQLLLEDLFEEGE